MLFLKLLKYFFIAILTCAYIVSCTSKETIIEEELSMSPKEKLIDSFNKNKNITCKSIIENDTILTLTGLNNGFIWFAEYDALTLVKRNEWKDNTITDSIINFYSLTNSEYYPHKIYDITPIFRKKNTVGEILTFFFNNRIDDNPGKSRYFGTQTIFINSPLNKRTIFYYSDTHTIRETDKPIHWYKDSYLIGGSIFTIKGDSLYGNEKLYKSSLNYYKPITYEEVINYKSGDINRFNYKNNTYLWNIDKFDLLNHFNVNISSSYKAEIELLKTDSIVWTFKLVITPWGKDKTEYAFNVNIETGELQ